jgi:penicillin-binding protein 1A
MKAAHEHKPPSEFPRPAGVVTITIDKHTGKLAYPDDPDAVDEVFLAGTEPTEVSEPYVPDGGSAVVDAAE